MASLDILYRTNKHTTDKGGPKHDNHSYFELYDKLFTRLQHRYGRVLEIGVERGDSLNLWSEYFINSKIYGIEHNLRTIDVEFLPGVTVIGADAYCENTLQLLRGIGKFDVIIDDGAHMPHQQEYFMKHYPELLAADGILIVEEAAEEIRHDKAAEAARLIEFLPPKMREVAYFDDRRTIRNHPGDCLIVCNMK